MPIQTKLQSITLTILFLFTCCTVTMIYLIQKNNVQKELEQFRRQEYAKTKQAMRNYVAIAYETVALLLPIENQGVHPRTILTFCKIVYNLLVQQ